MNYADISLYKFIYLSKFQVNTVTDIQIKRQLRLVMQELV